MKRLFANLGSIALFALVGASAARAADLPCNAVEPGEIRIDGLLDDWNGETGVDVGGTNRDFSFTAKCNFDHDSLYLVVDVRDDRLVRTKKPKLPDDRVVLAFADDKVKKTRVARLIIQPADSEQTPPLPRRLSWLPKRPPSSLVGIQVADALQPQGWAIEMRIPLARVPGFVPGSNVIQIAVGAVDVDAPRKPKVEAQLSTTPLDRAHLSRIELARTDVHVEAFLRDQDIAREDVRFEGTARVPPGEVRVVVANRLLAMIADEYNFIELPIVAPSDILDIRVVDLAGEGRDATLVRYREELSGGAGRREILAAYRLTGEGLRRVFGVELSRSRDNNRLDSRVSYVKRGAATDIVVDAARAIGWTEATYKDPPAEDVVPILLPWSHDKREVFQFRGDEYTRGD